MEGMARRLGNEASPSKALRLQHVMWNQRHRQQLFFAAVAPRRKLQLAQANVAELLAWLAWLRGGELFNLRRDDVEIFVGDDAVAQGFCAAAMILKLKESTKSSQTQQADVVVALNPSSGLKLGYWYCAMVDLHQQLCPNVDMLFVHSNGRPWTSHYFRTHHVYPLLYLQQAQDDPYLKPFDGTPGKRIEEHFFSMHSYRRGADSHVHKKHPLCRRAATTVEIYEHGRWRRRHKGNEAMPTHYFEMPLGDRLMITLECM